MKTSQKKLDGAHAYYRKHREAILLKKKLYYERNPEKSKLLKQKHDSPEKKSERALAAKKRRVLDRQKPDWDEKKKRKNLVAAAHAYGFDPEFISLENSKQNGVCKICNKENQDRRKSKFLAIDHCHDTGKFRGLLCHKCNLGLGHFNDDPKLLRVAADYLEQTRRKEVTEFVLLRKPLSLPADFGIQEAYQ